MACGGVCVLDPRADCGTGLLCDFFLSSNASHLENEKCLRTASLCYGFNQVSTGLARSLARVAVANRTGLGEVRTLGTRTSSCSLVGESDSQERETSSRARKIKQKHKSNFGAHAPYTGLASRTHCSLVFSLTERRSYHAFLGGEATASSSSLCDFWSHAEMSTRCGWLSVSHG